jgi:hypothetical protein
MVFTSVVTFESDRGEPMCVRGRVVESDASEAARKAVFRALPEAGRTKWESCVVVLTRTQDAPPAPYASSQEEP